MRSCRSWTHPDSSRPGCPAADRDHDGVTEESDACPEQPAGAGATAEQRAGLKAAYPHVAAMAERVRKPRGRMAEPALTYGFAEEDLA